jgi:hypothetical protein
MAAFKKPCKASVSPPRCQRLRIDLANEAFGEAAERAFVHRDEQPRPRKPPEEHMPHATAEF